MRAQHTIPSHMPRPPLISPADADFAYAAAQCVVEIHRRAADHLRVGMTLAQIDTFVAKQLVDLKCTSCFLHYRVGRGPAFPSYACLSVNECVVHGTAGYFTRPMQEGDLLKLDIGVWHKGWIGDAGWTYCFKKQTPEIKKFMACGKESLRRGVEQMRPGKMLVEWARAVQTHVETECGYHCVRGLGGHGIGRKLHGPPFVSNVVPDSKQDWQEALDYWLPGTLVAVEPMLAIGTSEVVHNPKCGSTWPVFTADGSLSVHYEHDVFITEKGPRVLTEGMDKLPDVVG